MKAWQAEAIKRVDMAAKEMKKKILAEHDNGYTKVSGTIDITLSKSSVSGGWQHTFSHPIWARV